MIPLSLCCVVRKLFSWSSRLLWTSFYILTFLTWKILIFRSRKSAFFKCFIFVILSNFLTLDLLALLFSCHLFQVSCLFFLLATACSVIFYHMIMILFYSEVLVRLLSYGKHLGIASCQLLSVHQEKCLLLPVSLGAKATVLLPRKGGKKHFPSLQLLYFLQGQTGNRSSQTKQESLSQLSNAFNWDKEHHKDTGLWG